MAGNIDLGNHGWGSGAQRYTTGREPAVLFRTRYPLFFSEEEEPNQEEEEEKRPCLEITRGWRSQADFGSWRDAKPRWNEIKPIK
jgi:hypothetical protein